MIMIFTLVSGAQDKLADILDTLRKEKEQRIKEKEEELKRIEEVSRSVFHQETYLDPRCRPSSLVHLLQEKTFWSGDRSLTRK